MYRCRILVLDDRDISRAVHNIIINPPQLEWVAQTSILEANCFEPQHVPVQCSPTYHNAVLLCCSLCFQVDFFVPRPVVS